MPRLQRRHPGINNPALTLLLALSLGVAVLAGCDAASGLSAQQHIEKARSYASKGDTKASVIELKNALQKDPNLAEARLLLGKAYLDDGDAQAARNEIEKAMALGIKTPEAKISLLQALLALGEFQKVLDNTGAGDNSPKVLSLRADALFGMRKVEEAKAAYTQVLNIDANSLDAHMGLARAAAMERRYDDAQAEIDKARQAHPDEVSVWLVAGDLAMIRGRAADAEAAFRKALEIKKEHPLGQLNMARVMIAQNKPDEALKYLTSYDKSYPGRVGATFLRAYALSQKKDYDAAKDLLRQVLAAVPDHLQSQLMLANIHYLQGQTAQAEELITRFTAAVPDYPPARNLQGAILLAANKPDEAVKVLEGPEAENDPQRLMLLGNAYMVKGDYAKGSDLLEKAAQLAPDAASIKTQLALSHLATGSTKQAITELQSAVELDPRLTKADVMLIYTYLREQKWDEAIEAAKKFAEKQPENPIAYNLLGAGYLGKADGKSAREQFERALKIKHDFSPARLNIASLDYQEGKKDAARKGLEELLQTDKNNLSALMMLGRLAADEGRGEDLVKYLEQARSAHPTATEPRIVLARHYLRAGKLTDALNVADEAVKLAPRHPDALQILAQAEEATGDINAALTTYGKLVEAKPQSPAVLLELAAVQTRVGKPDLSRQSIEQALKLDPKFLPARDALAGTQMMAGRLDEAMSLAKAIQKDFPDAADGHLVEGDIWMAKKDYPKAVTAYEAAYAKTQNSLLVLKLKEGYKAKGDRAAAYKVLEDWISRQPRDALVKLSLAGDYQQDGKTDRAVAIYEELIKADEKNVAALNNLAWLYHTTHDPRAADLALKAYDLAPQRPEVIDTYGWILVEEGKVERGLELLQKATERAGNSPDIHYHYGAALAKSGDKAKARAEIEKALAAGDFGEREAAGKLLETLR